ncbi:hypothetical protein [Staphylococcus aureus]|uniref:hypothetical protein n=1 Tax=Staphylococcus aureus TaxID=1280 RepID=UPI001643A13A|nr:hypothetical protein [Staphylococcus aureus]MDW4275872.1 hypothetical protein [Staphylococcus saprophyticus]MDW4374801.1 hypothetical protein [Staphylococcus saprophyticus]
MEKFKEAITNYIEKDENFALFIDGEWTANRASVEKIIKYMNKLAGAYEKI